MDLMLADRGGRGRGLMRYTAVSFRPGPGFLMFYSRASQSRRSIRQVFLRSPPH